MTTGQQADPALSAAIDAWHAACHDGAAIEDGMRRVVEAVRAAEPRLDAEAWRRICLSAYENLPSDTTMTMAQVDRVLMHSRAVADQDTSTLAGSAAYGVQVERIAAVTGVDREDVDSILTWCSRDAAPLLGEPAPLPPLAELVTDEDMRISDGIYNTELGTGNVTWPAMRAALEVYGARLVARLGRTP